MDIQDVPFAGTMIAKATACPVEDEPGYQLEHPGGAMTWMPEQLFLSSFRVNGAMRFGDAVEYLKQGQKVARSGDGGFLQIVEGRIMTGADDMISGEAWEPSADEVLAEDWRLVP